MDGGLNFSLLKFPPFFYSLKASLGERKGWEEPHKTIRKLKGGQKPPDKLPLGGGGGLFLVRPTNPIILKSVMLVETLQYLYIAAPLPVSVSGQTIQRCYLSQTNLRLTDLKLGMHTQLDW